MGKSRVKGITIQIGGDTTGLDKALQGVNKQTGNTQAKLKDVERLLKLDPTNTTLLEQKQKLLAEAIDKARKKLDILNQANDEVRDKVKNYDAWKKAYDPIKDQIDDTTKKLRELKEQQQETADCGEMDTDAYKALTEEVQKTSQELRDLKAEAKEVDEQFGKPMSPEAWDSLQREIIETEQKMKDLKESSKNNLDQLGDSLDGTTEKMKKLGDAAATVKDKADTVASTFKPVTTAVVGLATTAVATVPATEELREGLSKLDANAKENAVSVDAAREAWKEFSIQSGETDSSIEAVSNLLQAGFTESNLQQAVEGLAGAAQRFPDTLKVESLADSLQETLAGGSATGQFSELLSRLGMDVDSFNTSLAECTTETEKQNLALQVLTDAGLASSYNAWKENNEALLENKEANLELKLATAEFAETVMPYVTTALEQLKNFLEWFNDLPDAAKKAIAVFALLVAGISPVASAVSGVSSIVEVFTNKKLPGMSSVISTISTTVLPGLGTAFSSLWGLISANPIGAIITLIVALVAGIAIFGDKIQEKLQSIDDYMQNVFAIDWTQTFGPVLGGALNKFVEFTKNIWDSFKQILDGVIDLIRGVFTGDWERAWSGVQQIFGGIASGLVTLLKTPISGCLSIFTDFVSKVATNGDKIKATLQKLDDYLQGVFATDWTETFGPVLGGALNDFFDGVKELWDSCKEVFDGVIDFIQNVFSGNWKAAWDSVVDIFKGVFSGLSTLLKSPINAVISMINTAIEGIDWVIEGVNKIPGVSIGTIGKIPYLAEGGEVIQGNAVVGENGPELMTVLQDRTVVQPLTNNYHTTTRSMGGVSIAVYGAPGQDVRELAELVSQEMQQIFDSEEAALT